MCFNTDKARPICLEAECDETAYSLHVRAAGSDLVCNSEGQTHLIPQTDVTFTCPNLLSICPHMACPASCSGHGICDWSETKPVCKCFDQNDFTAGCFNSFRNVPPKIGWNDNVNREDSSSHRISAKYHGLMLPFILTVIW